MNYIIAVGYPLRLFPGEQGTEVEIELLNRTCLLKGVQAVIWGQLFQVQECPETWMPDILELYKSGAVVMGETQEELLLHLLPLHPLRQGFCIQDGVGRTKICLGGQLFPLSPVQEMLWRDANVRWK